MLTCSTLYWHVCCWFYTVSACLQRWWVGRDNVWELNLFVACFVFRVWIQQITNSLLGGEMCFNKLLNSLFLNFSGMYLLMQPDLCYWSSLVVRSELRFTFVIVDGEATTTRFTFCVIHLGVVLTADYWHLHVTFTSHSMIQLYLVFGN